MEARVWSSDDGLRERVLAALKNAVEPLPGSPVPDAPPGAVVHITLDLDDGSGSVFVLSGPSDAGALRSALEAAPAGPTGLVADSDIESRLTPTVLAVAAGQVVLPAELVAASHRPMLTNREKQVLALVVMGLGNREIGGRLHLSESTVKSHLFAAYRKLGVSSRGEATRLILDRQTGTGLGILEISEAGTQSRDSRAGE